MKIERFDMNWGLLVQGIGAATNLASTIAGAVNQAEANKLQQKSIDEQKRQSDLMQKNLKDSQAKKDEAEKNAMNTSSDFLGKENKDDDKSEVSGTLNGNSASLSTSPNAFTSSFNDGLPMERK